MQSSTYDRCRTSAQRPSRRSRRERSARAPGIERRAARATTRSESAGTARERVPSAPNVYSTVSERKVSLYCTGCVCYGYNLRDLLSIRVFCTFVRSHALSERRERCRVRAVRAVRSAARTACAARAACARAAAASSGAPPRRSRTTETP